MTEAGTGLEKDCFPEDIVAIEMGVQAIAGPGQDREPVQIDRIRSYKCREYDYFTKDCPTSREEKEIEQLQQMLDLDDEQTSLTSLVANTQDNFSRVNSEENLKTVTFKLGKGRNDPTTFLPPSSQHRWKSN